MFWWSDAGSTRLLLALIVWPFDPAFFSRRATSVPTPDKRHVQHLAVHCGSSEYYKQTKMLGLLPFPVGRLWPLAGKTERFVFRGRVGASVSIRTALAILWRLLVEMEARSPRSPPQTHKTAVLVFYALRPRVSPPPPYRLYLSQIIISP